MVYDISQINKVSLMKIKTYLLLDVRLIRPNK